MATPNPSDATFFQNQTAVTAREAESPAADFDDGCNRAGSNAPGVGIGTQAGGVAPPSWSLTDQDEDARTPQDSQHIGGSGLGAGESGKGTVPINVSDNDADFNDTVSLSVLATGWEKDVVA